MGIRKKIADLFCGAGGTTTGAESTGEVDCVFAVNHWDRAIETHSANHPHAKHVRKALHDVGPSECPKIDGLFASPSCTHHSRARGGRPTSDQQRSGAWEVMPWLDYHRPSWMVIENVPEFREWGPVGADGLPLKSGKGKLFDAWIKAVQSHGYRCEVGLLNAADFGAATSRLRLFVICRKGNRSAPWPEPTHSKTVGHALPGIGRSRWRAAAEIIDWSLPCPSLFGRTKPLADNTLKRIEAGLRKFVGPFIVPTNHGERAGQAPRLIAAHSPLPTLTGRGSEALVVPFQFKAAGNCPGLTRSIHQPVPTILSAGSHHGLVIPFLSQYYGTGEGSDPARPLPTVVTKDRHALITAYVGLHPDHGPSRSEGERQLRDTMRELGVTDVGLRMLQNHELAAAQGFPPDYQYSGTKAEVTKQIGNSVSPPVAKAITLSLLG